VRAAEELHQFAMQANQQGQRQTMELFKRADNTKSYPTDRLEGHLNVQKYTVSLLAILYYPYKAMVL
jgi:hypothetical protein